MLRIIGGFQYADEGEVLFEGKDIAGVPPYKRRINTVFQKYALFTHLNVYDNIAFGAERLQEDCRKRQRSTAGCSACSRLVKMSGYEKRSRRPALRRPAAAHRHRARAGQRAGGAAARRAAGRAGSEAAQGDADRAEDHAAAAGHHLHLCHPRSGGGADHVGHRRGHERTAASSRSATRKRIYDEPKNAFVADFIGESNIIPGVMVRDELVQHAGHRTSRAWTRALRSMSRWTWSCARRT